MSLSDEDREKLTVLGHAELKMWIRGGFNKKAGLGG